MTTEPRADHLWIATILSTAFDQENRISLHRRHRGVNYHIGLVYPPTDDPGAVQRSATDLATILNQAGFVGGQTWVARDVLTFAPLGTAATL